MTSSGWSNPSKIAISGGSNGGCLVGVTMNQSGQHFACGVADVGVLDLLRFHLFTIGHAWIPDFGDPDDATDFQALLKYSPYHNIQGDGYKYPSFLAVTSDHDDRVVPLHSFKFVARMQQIGGKHTSSFLLLRHQLNTGHGAGRPTMKIIEAAAEKLAFCMQSTNTVPCSFVAVT